MGEWQPIETAPKDLARYLFITKAQIQRVDKYTKEHRSGFRYNEVPTDPYTHWMPLPAPPSSKG